MAASREEMLARLSLTIPTEDPAKNTNYRAHIETQQDYDLAAQRHVHQLLAVKRTDNSARKSDEQDTPLPSPVTPDPDWVVDLKATQHLATISDAEATEKNEFIARGLSRSAPTTPSNHRVTLFKDVELTSLSAGNNDFELCEVNNENQHKNSIAPS